MMPRPGQTIEAHMHECAVLAGEFLPRATPAEIESLKAQHYTIDRWTEDAFTSGDMHFPAVTMYRWSQHIPGLLPEQQEFQDDEPSLSEADAWALALQHASTPEGPYW